MEFNDPGDVSALVAKLQSADNTAHGRPDAQPLEVPAHVSVETVLPIVAPDVPAAIAGSVETTEPAQEVIPKSQYDGVAERLIDTESRLVQSNSSASFARQQAEETQRQLDEIKRSPAFLAQQQQDAVDAELNKLGLDPDVEANRAVAKELVEQRAQIQSLLADNGRRQSQEAVGRLKTEWKDAMAKVPQLTAVLADPKLSAHLDRTMYSELERNPKLDLGLFAKQQAEVYGRLVAQSPPQSPPAKPQAPAVMPQPGSVGVGTANTTPAKTQEQIHLDEINAARGTPNEGIAVAKYARYIDGIKG